MSLLTNFEFSPTVPSGRPRRVDRPARKPLCTHTEHYTRLLDNGVSAGNKTAAGAQRLLLLCCCCCRHRRRHLRAVCDLFSRLFISLLPVTHCHDRSGCQGTVTVAVCDPGMLVRVHVLPMCPRGDGAVATKHARAVAIVRVCSSHATLRGPAGQLRIRTQQALVVGSSWTSVVEQEVTQPHWGTKSCTRRMHTHNQQQQQQQKRQKQQKQQKQQQQHHHHHHHLRLTTGLS